MPDGQKRETKGVKERGLLGEQKRMQGISRRREGTEGGRGSRGGERAQKEAGDLEENLEEKRGHRRRQGISRKISMKCCVRESEAAKIYGKGVGQSDENFVCSIQEHTS
jgi:hypothetical protein